MLMRRRRREDDAPRTRRYAWREVARVADVPEPALFCLAVDALLVVFADLCIAPAALASRRAVEPLLLVTGHAAAAATAWCVWRCAARDPGVVPPCGAGRATLAAPCGACGSAALDACVVCGACRAAGDDVHHCRSCDVCVRGRRHHCGFLGVCVTGRNARAFRALLACAAAGFAHLVYGLAFALDPWRTARRLRLVAGRQRLTRRGVGSLVFLSAAATAVGGLACVFACHGALALWRRPGARRAAIGGLVAAAGVASVVWPAS